MNILALDLATQLGWAHSSGRSGSLKLKKDKDPAMVRIKTLSAFLDTFDFLCPFDVIIVESAYIRFSGAACPLLEMRGAVMAWCCSKMIPFYGNFAATTIKKHATGKGNADKIDMVAAAQLRFPNQRVLDDNQADALLLLDLASQLYAASGLDGLNDGGAKKALPNDKPRTKRNSATPGSQRRSSAKPPRLVEAPEAAA